MGKGLKILYDCGKCPAYCCSYPRVQVTKKDLRRLAKFFGIGYRSARKKYTKKGEEPGERILRHHKDEYFGTICKLLDRETRRCTVYDARPEICREFPGVKRCGYYDFLVFERDAQEDPEYVSQTYNH